MQMIIFSDTHGRIEKCASVLKTAERADLILHAGDYAEDAQRLSQRFAMIPMYHVKGNNDLWTNASAELDIFVADKKILLTHGHDYGVKNGLFELKEKAKEGNYDMVVFGHTHKPLIEFSGKTMFLNPGSMGFYDCTYAVAEIEDGKIKASIVEYR